MAQYVKEARRDRFHRLSDFETIEYKNNRVIGIFRDDNSEAQEINLENVAVTMLHGDQVIPSAPGYYLLSFCSAQPQDPVHRHPIVAWRVDATRARPVIADPYALGGEYVLGGIELPDGRVAYAGKHLRDAAEFAAAVGRPLAWPTGM